jgi:hypothetical protein
MASVNLGGYDPNSGFEPDDSTDIPWRKNVRLPGQWQGGGQGFGTGGNGWGDTDLPGNFGRGGFRPSGGAITAPATGTPPGLSLSGGSADGINMSLGPDDTITPPENSPIPPNKQVGARTNPFTDAYINPSTGRPEFVGGPNATIGPGSAAANPRVPMSWLNPLGRIGIAAGAIMQPTPTASDDTISPEMAGQRPQHPSSTGRMPQPPPGLLSGGGIGSDARFPTATMPGHGGIGSDANAPLMGAGGFPTTYGAPGQQPPVPGAAPGAAPGSIPIGGGPGNVMQAPTGGRSPVRTPASAGPAAVRQQPNMGSYDPNGRFVMIDRTNAPAESGGRGGGGGPMQTALNLSSLFGGGAPAAAPQTARPDLAQRVPLDQTPLPPVRPTAAPVAAQPMMPPRTPTPLTARPPVAQPMMPPRTPTPRRTVRNQTGIPGAGPGETIVPPWNQ